MDIFILKKLLISALSIVLVMLLSHALKGKAKEVSKSRNLKKTRYFAMRRVISFLSLFVIAIIIIFVWGINIKNLWISLAGVLAMIAVAFVAVWSLIGNILAGIILYFTTPFKINDTIEVLPDGIKGKVLAINTFYTIIADEEENYINIPNSLFFQKYVKNFRRH